MCDVGIYKIFDNFQSLFVLMGKRGIRDQIFPHLLIYVIMLPVFYNSSFQVFLFFFFVECHIRSQCMHFVKILRMEWECSSLLLSFSFLFTYMKLS